MVSLKVSQTVRFCCVFVVALLAFFVSSAQAQIIELGQQGATDPATALPTGNCPDNCYVLTRTTAFQLKVGPDRTMYVAPSKGRIVAWSLGLGNPNLDQAADFKKRFGGVPKVSISILKPKIQRINRKKKTVYTLVASTPEVDVTPYFGQRIQMPLQQTLAIDKGMIVALSTSTWLPALRVGQEATTSWRASRTKAGCAKFDLQTALQNPGNSSMFECLYRGERLAYSATFISQSEPPKQE